MAWNTRTNWMTGQVPSAAEMNAPGLDVRTWGGDVNGGGHALSNVSLPQPEWVELAMQNGWVAYSGWNPAPAAAKDAMGFVHLRGAMKSGTYTGGTILFTLPVGMRPLKAEVLALAGPGDASNPPLLVIETSGACKVYSLTGNSFLYLAGSFSTF